MHDLKYGSITRRDLLAAGRLSMTSATRAHGATGGKTEPPLRRGPGKPFAVVSRQEDIATYVLVLRKGQEIVSTLLEFAREKRLVSGSLKATGAVSDAQIACFDSATNEYGQADVREPAEVVSLIGGLGLANGQPLLHMHTVLRLRDRSTLTGHLLEAHVLSRLEVRLTAWSRPLSRAGEVETGLKSLCLAS